MNMKIIIPEREIKFKFARSSGPGGQNVNRRETKVQGFWNPKESQMTESLTTEEKEQLFRNLKLTDSGEVFAESQIYRTQEQNKFEVIEKINNVVNTALKQEKKRIQTKPSKGAKERRLEEKKRKSEIKKSRQKIKYY